MCFAVYVSYSYPGDEHGLTEAATQNVCILGLEWKLQARWGDVKYTDRWKMSLFQGGLGGAA